MLVILFRPEALIFHIENLVDDALPEKMKK